MSHTSGGSRLSPHKWSSFRAKRASLLLLASGTCIELSGPRTPEQQTPSRHEHHLENRICAPVIGTLSPGSKAETLRSESLFSLNSNGCPCFFVVFSFRSAPRLALASAE